MNPTLATIFWIALGGAFGAVLRYLFTISTHNLLGHAFPYGTLAVNVIGSFIIGFFAISAIQRWPQGGAAWAFVVIGLLGAFTTFSSFSFETLTSFENGQVLIAILNVASNLVLCLAAVTIGTLLARQVFGA